MLTAKESDAMRESSPAPRPRTSRNLTCWYGFLMLVLKKFKMNFLLVIRGGIHSWGWSCAAQVSSMFPNFQIARKSKVPNFQTLQSPKFQRSTLVEHVFWVAIWQIPNFGSLEVCRLSCTIPSDLVRSQIPKALPKLPNYQTREQPYFAFKRGPLPGARYWTAYAARTLKHEPSASAVKTGRAVISQSRLSHHFELEVHEQHIETN